MLVLVTGGAASGKSEHAEKIVCARAHSKLYLATMQPFVPEHESRGIVNCEKEKVFIL